MRQLDSQTSDPLSAGEFVELLGEAERIAGFGIWKWDVASGRVHWSDELHRIYGLRPGEFGARSTPSSNTSTPTIGSGSGRTSPARSTR
jgi:hypothetical protein